MFKCIILDLDDTLHSVRQYALARLKVVAALVAEHCPSSSAESIFRTMRDQYDAGHGADLLNRTIHSHNLDPALLDVLLCSYRSVDDDTSLYADSREFLDLLRKRGLACLLATDGSPEVQRDKPYRLGIADYFQEIVCTEQQGKLFRKPDTRALEEPLARMGFDFSDCLAIGDHPVRDVEGYQDRGATVALIRRGDGRFRDMPPERKPDFEIQSLQDLERIVWPGIV